MKDFHDMTLREIRAAYYKTVNGIADEVFSQRLAPSESRDFVHESVDGSEWVIYTHKANLVACVSDNSGAYLDEECEEAPEARAYWAMLRDVDDRLEFLSEHDKSA